MKGKDSKVDLFNCLVEFSEGNQSGFRNFWVWAEGLSNAIEKVLITAQKLEIQNPIAKYIDYSDYEPPEEAFSIDNGQTFVEEEVYTFPTEECYKLPKGVIFSLNDNDEFEDTQIKLGFDLVTYEDGLIEVEAVVEESKILKIYLDLIAILPEIRVFMLKLQEDWEDEDNEEIYVNEKLSSIELIKDFINENAIDTLQNGHLTLTTYFDEGQTNINISDHKTLVIMSYEKNIIDRAGKILKGYNLKKKKELICVSRGFHHYHYKLHNALNRKQLIQKLKAKGFSKWE